MRKSCKKPPDRTKSVKGGGNMKLSAIALKNLKRNFSFYSLYLFSVSFVLMIYFCFTSFSMNQIIMEKISSDGRVETMCRTVAVFIMAFVIFYMFYSNSFFMRRRMRELGIYSLLGYRKSTILKLLIFENVNDLLWRYDSWDSDWQYSPQNRNRRDCDPFWESSV